MSSIDQYIELYEQNRQLIDRHSAPLLNSLRPAACDVLKRSGRFADLVDERYQHTSIEKMMAPDYGVNLARLNLPVDIARSFACSLPGMSPLIAVVAGDRFVPTDTLLSRMPQGVTVSSLSEAAKANPDLVSRYLGKVAPVDDPSVALNTMLVQDGVFIHVPKGMKMTRPIQLVNILSSPTPLMAVRRIIIALEEGAEADVVICDHTHDSQQSYLSQQVTEVSLARDASLGLYCIEEASNKTSRHALTFVRQLEASRLNSNFTALSGGVSRSEFVVDLQGEHTDALLTGAVIGNGSRHVDCNTTVRHAVPRCHSNQLFRYVLADDSTGVFDGIIKVEESAPFTAAFQSARGVLASESARMYTKPRLEIYTDEVKCSHGAAVGQLDPTALFYMRSRGIPEAQARVMLMQAFMADVVQSISLEPMRARLHHLIEQTFSGRAASCRGCKE